MVKKFNNKYKEVVRQHIKPLVNKNTVMFSLPYLQFGIEGKAKRVVCCEKDNTTFEAQQIIAPPNCELHNAMASEFIGQEPFDLVFLDLCGSLSKEFFTCIKRVNLKPEGILITTLLKAREHPYYSHLLKGDRILGYYNILRQEGLYLYKTIEYNATSPMIVLFAKKVFSKSIERIILK